MTDLWRLSALELAAAIRRREVTPGEAVDAAIDRVERVDPRIHAVVTPLFDRARARAARVDLTAPFAGVPLLMKDSNQHVAGTPFFAGTAALRDAGWISTRTTELAARFEGAGFVVIGKANVPELATGVTTEPEAFAPTANPWDPARSPGGSSGGSAAAVAAGLVPLAHGADHTGSLRYPAAACGVVTLKPSRGRVPSNAATGERDSTGAMCEFAIARSAADLRALFRVVAGGGSPPGEQRMAPQRVGLLAHDPMLSVELHPACRAAVEAAGNLLERLGHHVELAYPPALDDVFSPILGAFAVITQRVRAESVAWLERAIGRPLRDGDVSAVVLDQAAIGRRRSPTEVAEAQAAVDAAFAPVATWWSDHDLLVTPTLRQPPWPLGQDPGPLHAGVFPSPASLVGLPALSLPLATDDSGLPVGVQIVGGPGRDEQLLDLATDLEALAGWRDRWPPIS